MKLWWKQHKYLLQYGLLHVQYVFKHLSSAAAHFMRRVDGKNTDFIKEVEQQSNPHSRTINYWHLNYDYM